MHFRSSFNIDDRVRIVGKWWKYPSGDSHKKTSPGGALKDVKILKIYDLFCYIPSSANLNETLKTCSETENWKFTPLIETRSISIEFIWDSPLGKGASGCQNITAAIIIVHVFYFLLILILTTRLFKFVVYGYILMLFIGYGNNSVIRAKSILPFISLVSCKYNKDFYQTNFFQQIALAYLIC